MFACFSVSPAHFEFYAEDRITLLILAVDTSNVMCD